ncbi:MAG: SMC-Scp complex subunit ScpB [bacterium]
MLTVQEIANVVEGILFLSPRPVKLSDIAVNLDVDPGLLNEAMERLKERYADCGLELCGVAGGFELTSRKDYVEHLRAFFGELDKSRLSRAALETMSIIAYKQPVSRADIEDLRGVNSSGAIHSLLDKSLIRISDRGETIGRPFMYSTTPDFLRYLGLEKLEDLPPIESFEKKV